MSDNQSEQTATDQVVTEASEEELDQRADLKVVLIVFTTAVIMAVHFISGFTVDF